MAVSRISSLASGLDTDSLVKNYLATYQSKIDTTYRSKVKAEWKLETYNEINKSVSSFKDSYFSVLGEKSLTKSSAYNAFKVSTTANTAVKITADSTASAQNFNITSVRMATNAAITSKANSQKVAVRGSKLMYDVPSATGSAMGDDVKSTTTIGELATEFGLAEGEKLSFSINGETFSFEQNVTLGDVASTVNLKRASTNVVMAFTGGAFTLQGTDSHGEMTLANITGTAFKTDSAEGGFKLADPVRSAGLDTSTDTFKSLADSKGITLSGNTFSITVGNGTTRTFDITNGDSTYKTIDEVMNEVNTALGGEAVMSFDDNTNRFSLTGNDYETITTSGAIFGSDSVTGMAAGKFGSSTSSGKISRSDTIEEVLEKLGTGGLVTNNTLSFSITAENTNTGAMETKSFSYDISTTTISTIMDDVNNKSGLDASFSFSELFDGFTVSTKSTGSQSSISISGLEAFNLSSQTVEGSDAVLTLDDGTTVVQSSNLFTLDGMTFEISGDYNVDNNGDPVTGATAATPINVAITKDFDSVVDKVKGFIEEYNTMVEKLNTLYNEKLYRDYEPLTEDEKDEITEKQAEKIEGYAKSGILRNDTTLGSLLSGLRSSLLAKVGETGMSATDLGITTVAWNSSTWETEQGKLQLDEDKLRSALSENPNAVQEVLAGVSTDASGNIDATVTNGKAKSGLFTRMREFMSDFNTSMRTNNIMSTASNITSLTDKIDDLEDRMDDAEERYWKKITAMETAMSNYNSQLEWLTAQLGTNKSNS